MAIGPKGPKDVGRKVPDPNLGDFHACGKSGDADTERTIDTIVKESRTGNIGDGKIFVTAVKDAIRVRTGERGDEAL